jgi:two-component system LytT family response regulator
MIKAVIVDDEKDGRDALAKIIKNYCKNAEVVALASCAEEALKAIEEFKPDLIFLDIEMPLESGFDLLRKAEAYDFKTIFITAHSHYAIKAFKFAAAGYLLKPVDIDDLIDLVNKVEKAIAQKTEKSKKNDHPAKIKDKISLPVKDGLIYLHVDEIIRFEGDGSYTKAWLTNGKCHLISRNIKEYEDLLSSSHFFRCHISHLVNLRHVKGFSRHDGYYADMSDGVRIEISRRKKDEFVSRMDSQS